MRTITHGYIFLAPWGVYHLWGTRVLWSILEYNTCISWNLRGWMHHASMTIVTSLRERVSYCVLEWGMPPVKHNVAVSRTIDPPNWALSLFNMNRLGDCWEVPSWNGYTRKERARDRHRRSAHTQHHVLHSTVQG